MNITLSIDEKVADEARRVVQSMGKSLNQLVRDYLKQLAGPEQLAEEIAELRRLGIQSQGDPRGWRFNRDELHERARVHRRSNRSGQTEDRSGPD